MNILASIIVLIGLIVMISFVARQFYKVNKEFLSRGKIPIKEMLKYVGVTVLAILCFVFFAILVFVILSYL